MRQLLTEAAGILASIGTGLSFWLGHFPVLTSSPLGKRCAAPNAFEYSSHTTDCPLRV